MTATVAAAAADLAAGAVVAEKVEVGTRETTCDKTENSFDFVRGLAVC